MTTQFRKLLHPPGKPNAWQITSITLLCATIFTIDLYTPLGTAAAVPYSLCILATLPAANLTFTLTAAITATALTTIGLFTSTDHQITNQAITNRAIAIYIIWAAAVFCLYVRNLLNTQQKHLHQIKQSQHRLQQSIQQALDANQTKSRFLANMSHEIRTPLTAIIGYAEMLIDHDEQQITKTQQDDASHTILRNGRHLLTIVNEILDMSKIEEGKLHTERLKCCTATIIADAIDTIRCHAKQKNLHLAASADTPLPKAIQTDPTRLKQILTNLLANAIKFTEHGSVTLNVAYQQQNNKPALQFTVTDTGIGMTQQQIQTAFEPFSQADASTTRRFGGTGLGVSISKQLANMLGGDLTAQSAPNHGTTFTLTIDPGPIKPDNLTQFQPEQLIKPRTNNTKPTANTTAAPLNMRILLADDAPDNQRLISHHLKRAGATTDIVDNGQDALQTALQAQQQNNPYDLILMDMQMPVMDGFSATQQLRKNGYTGTIIALTASALKNTKGECEAAGCDAFATKPIDRHKLIALLHKHNPHNNNTTQPASPYEPPCPETSTPTTPSQSPTSPC